MKGIDNMEFEEVKRYIDSVKESNKFKELDDFTKMTQIKENQDIYENIKYYISIYHSRHDCEEFFQPDYEYFIKFLEHYLKDEPIEMVLDDSGYIDLSKSLHLVRPLKFVGGSGYFIDNHKIFTDGSKYICKLPLYHRGGSGISNGYCLYAPLIASYIAKQLNIDAAEISLACAYNGYRILSKNFLKPNEEIVTYTEDTEEALVSEQLRQMEEALRLRRFPTNEIEEVKFDFLKQEFVAKLIGLKDQKMENSPLVVSVDEEENKHVKMAPMLDFDYSFHIGEEVPLMRVRKCDNGEVDIGSLIEQYKDYPGFKEFVINSMKSFDITRVFKRIFEETGNKLFKDYENNEQMMKFINFVNRNARIARAAIAKIYENEMEEK